MSEPARDNKKLREYCNRYEKTENGFLMRMYRNMKSRVTGVQKAKAHLYVGKELLTKEEFYEWAKHSPMFWVLFRQYQESGYDRMQAPTVDRLDSKRGYTLDNMQWVTHRVNSYRGTMSRYANSSS